MFLATVPLLGSLITGDIFNGPKKPIQNIKKIEKKIFAIGPANVTNVFSKKEHEEKNFSSFVTLLV